MTLAVLRDFLFWCAVLNYGFLILWAVLAITAKRPMQQLCLRLYRISPEQCDAIQFAGILFYKVMIFMLFIFPYIALRIVGVG